MKKQKLSDVYFRHLEHVGTSYYGNPQYCFNVYKNGEEILANAKTARDAGCAYGIRNYEAVMHQFYRGKGPEGGDLFERVLKLPSILADIEYHETKTGSIIVDYICTHKEEEGVIK